MSEMVERVARATYAVVYGTEWQHVNASTKPIMLRLARAAIAAMRDPTDAMVDAWPDYSPSPPDIAKGWRTMIDAALEE